MTSSPCKDCTGRYVGCHAKCEKYLSWQKIHEQERAVMIKARNEEEAYTDYLAKAKRRMRRSR